jgi:hypothetical protein
MPITARPLRRRGGTQKNRMQANVAPPAAYRHGGAERRGSIAALLAAVVKIVRVAVAAAEPLIVTGDVDPKLKVGMSDAPDGLEVMAAVNVTAPVKPPAGVTVIVDVFPVAAPGERLIALPVMVKPALTALVTVTVAVPMALV